jgi:hypothetical protein
MKENKQVDTVNNKNRDLFLGILFDGIGMVSFTIPFLGELSDVVWAPLSSFLMMWMYKGNIRKIAGTVSFIEEIIPFTDVIPSFTLTWIYNYWINKEKE